jgi:hypothetical protein
VLVRHPTSRVVLVHAGRPHRQETIALLTDDRRLASLPAYVVIAEDRVGGEQHARRDLGRWRRTLDDLDATFELPAAGCALRLRKVCDRVAPFAAEPPR